MDALFIDTALLIALVLILLTIYVQHKLTYWNRTRFPFIKPSFPYGNLHGTMDRIHLAFQLQNYYKEMKGKGPFGGLYLMWRPAVLALDLEFIKTILVKDFQYFQDRGVYYNARDDPLSAHLIALDGSQWKKMRTIFTPTFTSGKMRHIYPIMSEVGERLRQCLTSEIGDRKDVEMTEYLARYTTDVIGTCAFGIECNSLNNANAEFRTMCRKIFKEPRHSMKSIFLMAIFSNLCRFFRMKTHTDDVSTFFMDIVRETVHYREMNDVARNDFMDILLKLKNRPAHDGHKSKQLTFNEIAAQVFVFFAAGYETSATAITYCLYELALNPGLQHRARKEIDDVLRQYNGELTYAAIMQMTYIECIIMGKKNERNFTTARHFPSHNHLSSGNRCGIFFMVFSESLRKYPPVGLLFRCCTRNYAMPNTNYILPKHTKVWIPVYAIHHDPEYYSNPQQFNPDRFAAEAIKRPALSFLPFGEGPRNCIGTLFAMMQARVGLIALLRSFEFTPCSQTLIPMKFETKELILTPKNGMWLNLRKL